VSNIVTKKSAYKVTEKLMTKSIVDFGG